MNKRSFALVAIVAVAAMLAAPAWNFKQDKKAIQAYIMKVVRDVEKKSPTTGWVNAVTLDQLKSGYEVRTKEKSFALIRFADESKVAVREKSVITISGETDGKQILNRDVYIERGRAVFQVKKQETEQFRFTSPISVASIRGTEGGTSFDPGVGESDITIVTGVAEFRSTRTNCQTTVGAGQTGKIDSTGNCSNAPATQSSLNNNNPNSSVNQGNDPGTGGNVPGKKDTTQTPPPSGGTATFSISGLDGTLNSGRAARFKISLTSPPTTIANVTFYYRIQGQASYKSVPMSLSGANASVDVSADDIRAYNFECYLSMKGSNGTTYTFPETSPDSNPYVLPVTPRKVSIRVPVNDPSGALKFLEITYEE
ncbi:MAG: FecR domain-containing protein [Ignavibacteriales bacterium]|nr:FecR domain-containing protein [Ignavibacteriales bacterium]